MCVCVCVGGGKNGICFINWPQPRALTVCHRNIPAITEWILMAELNGLHVQFAHPFIHSDLCSERPMWAEQPMPRRTMFHVSPKIKIALSADQTTNYGSWNLIFNNSSGEMARPLRRHWRRRRRRRQSETMRKMTCNKRLRHFGHSQIF